MLSIRKSQNDVFLEERLQQLQQWLLPHLREHFSDELEDDSDDDVRTLIEVSVARAVAIGANQSPTICQFVHLWVLFGDELEALPWVRDVLSNRSIGDANARMEALTERAYDVLRAEEEAEGAP